MLIFLNARHIKDFHFPLVGFYNCPGITSNGKDFDDAVAVLRQFGKQYAFF